MSEKAYIEVPVIAAQQIAKNYSKGLVLVISFDEQHDLLHCTTYGDSAEMKVVAANMGEDVMGHIGADLEKKTTFSDFRGQPGGTAGVDLIAAERARQFEQEGHSLDGDDSWLDGELAKAAVLYAMPPETRFISDARTGLPNGWPWQPEWWKPCPNDRIRELAKAGALIAAEIDRLQRKQAAEVES